MDASNEKTPDPPAAKAIGGHDPAEVMEAMSLFSKSNSRASSEDVAEALSQAFGGAKGFALLMKELAFSPNTRPATRAKIISNVMSYIERTAKQYGDMARLAAMSKDQIEIKLCRLLVRHKFVVPIEGVNVNALFGE